MVTKRVAGLMVMLAMLPVGARAQGVLFGPAMEVGVNVASGTADIDSDETRAAAGPRVTLHLTPKNSLVFFGDLAASKETLGDDWTRTRMIGATFRRALYETGGFRFGALAGAGLSRRETFTSERAFPGLNGPTVIPATLRSSVTPLFTFGVNFEQRVASRLGLHGDLLAVAGGNVSAFRVQAGASLPLHPYTRRRTDAPIAYGSTSLRVGQHLWITDSSGEETQGAISAIDGSRIEIETDAGRRTFARAEIRRIAVPDPIGNGTIIGAVVGGAALGGFVALIADALCDSSECDNLGPTLAGTAYGVGFGALFGALIDSLRDRPRTVFNAASGAQFHVAPTLGRRHAGTRVSLSW